MAGCGEGSKGTTGEGGAGVGVEAGDKTAPVFGCVDQKDDDKYVSTREGGKRGGSMGRAAAKEGMGGLEGDGGAT